MASVLNPIWRLLRMDQSVVGPAITTLHSRCTYSASPGLRITSAKSPSVGRKRMPKSVVFGGLRYLSQMSQAHPLILVSRALAAASISSRVVGTLTPYFWKTSFRYMKAAFSIWIGGPIALSLQQVGAEHAGEESAAEVRGEELPVATDDESVVAPLGQLATLVDEEDFVDPTALTRLVQHFAALDVLFQFAAVEEIGRLGERAAEELFGLVVEVGRSAMVALAERNDHERLGRIS